MKSQQIKKNNEWIPPLWILKALGEFDLNPCTPTVRPWSTSKYHYYLGGLDKDWFGRVFLNPPFERYERPKWMKKMALHGNGIILLPATMETQAFKDHVWGKCDGILILSRRPHFYYTDGTKATANSGCGFVLVAYGKSNFEILKRSGLGYAVIQV